MSSTLQQRGRQTSKKQIAAWVGHTNWEYCRTRRKSEDSGVGREEEGGGVKRAYGAGSGWASVNRGGICFEERDEHSEDEGDVLRQVWVGSLASARHDKHTFDRPHPKVCTSVRRYCLFAR